MIGGFGERRALRPIGSVGGGAFRSGAWLWSGGLGGGRQSGRRGYRTRVLAVSKHSLYPLLRCEAACWRPNSTSTPPWHFALVFNCRLLSSNLSKCMSITCKVSLACLRKASPEAWMHELCLHLMCALGFSLMEQKHRFRCEGRSWPSWWAATDTRATSSGIYPNAIPFDQR